MTATDLTVFNTADWIMDKSFMVQLQDPGEPYEAPCPCYLIEHPEGLVLFDTGLSYEVTQQPHDYGTFGAPHMAEFSEAIDNAEDRTAVAQLQEEGYDPADVDHVVMSHLHSDHAGNVSEFRDAEFLVHEDELGYAWWPDPVQELFYLEGDFNVLRSHGFSVTETTGRYDVFGDGSVVTIPTPGHTPGHQSLFVDLAGVGPIILGADVANHRAGYEAEMGPSFAWSLDETVSSIRKIKAEARKTGADVFLGHDREDQEALGELV